ncbi:MAG: hypothetical protein ACK4SQ_14280 [Allorhizobium sp.]
MTKITNTSDVKQAVHTTSGVIFIHPGKDRDVELTPEGMKVAEATEGLKIDGRTVRKRTQKAVDANEEPEAE